MAPETILALPAEFRATLAAGQLLDLPVYDHVIVAGDRWVSFAGAGLL
jgi:DNA repair protein RadC